MIKSQKVRGGDQGGTLPKGQEKVEDKKTWRERFRVLWNRLYFYPPPEPLPHTRLFWVATGLVTLFAAIFSAYFILYLTGLQDAFQTPAEDFGIMIQVIWTTLHGQLLHQTICNIVSDTNCYSLNGFARFAIHFEPILFPVSLIYLILPNPKTLLVLQTLIVASGAFPAFWMARLRLRNELAAAGIALLYLLYPGQQQASVFDFHAVTLTASLLLFTLYFMYTRRTLWLFVFAILSMACKEEIPLVIAMFGLWSILFQQRWRSGLGLILLAIVWVGMVFLAFHLFSPTGHPLLSSRYSWLGSSPGQILHTVFRHPRAFFNTYLFDPTRRQYLRILLGPAGYLPLLAPWVLVLAAPSILLNLLSADPNQHTGFFQYNAEIVPVLIFATIEAIVLIVWIAQWILARVRLQREKQAKQTKQLEQMAQAGGISRAQGVNSWVRLGLLAALLAFVLVDVVRLDATLGAMPYSQGFQWPHVSPHDQLAQHFIDMIPPTASVSAQSSLVPHISQRSKIYLFPYADDSADYIFLDVTGDIYPMESGAYTQAVKSILLNGKYGVVAAQDGYLLLKRGLTPPGLSPYSPAQSGVDALPNLPAGFCSFVQDTPQQVTNPLSVNFIAPDGSANVSLIGYNFAPPSAFVANMNIRYMLITTFWKVNTPTTPPLRIQVILTDKHGKEEYSSYDFPAISWCSTRTWKPGMILGTQSRTLYIGGVPKGLTHVSVAVLPFAEPSGKIPSGRDRLPVQILSAPPSIVPTLGTNALQLDTFTI